jgi:hypothetical protein
LRQSLTAITMKVTNTPPPTMIPTIRGPYAWQPLTAKH